MDIKIDLKNLTVIVTDAEGFEHAYKLVPLQPEQKPDDINDIIRSRSRNF